MKTGSVYRVLHSRAAGLRKTAVRPAGPAQGHAIAIIDRQIPTPAGESWDTWFAGESVTADFLMDREQPMERAGKHS